MGGFALIILLPLLVYCGVQTGLDVNLRRWPMALWGAGMVCLVIWMIRLLLIGPQY